MFLQLQTRREHHALQGGGMKQMGMEAGVGVRRAETGLVWMICVM